MTDQSDTDSDTYEYWKRAPARGADDERPQWRDVTAEFAASVRELALGELLHERLFGLFEAMSAIEMMDPKMDAGMACNRGGANKPLTFERAAESGELRLEGVGAPETIGIIDATLSCLVSWLEGHSLVQTVFTNLYLHRPLAIKDKPLRAFCVAVYKILDLIRNYINSAQVYEEEDFQPMSYGYALAVDNEAEESDGIKGEITEQKCVALLREQEDDLYRRSRNNQLEGEELIGLFSRIKFTRVFYQMLSVILKRDQQSINDTTRLLGSCGEMIIIMTKTMSKGIPADDDPDAPYPMGFEPLVNQRLLPPTFPRYTRIKPRAEALQYFGDLINNFKEALKVNSIASFHSVLEFFIKFSQSQPCILSRSVLQLLYLGRNGMPLGSNVPEALREAARSFICPPALIPRYQLLNNPQTREYVDIFLNHCARPFTLLLQVCGHNRARQRDKLAHLLTEFATLKEEADNIDLFLRALPRNADAPRSAALSCFATWIFYHIVKIMIMYLLSGLELELYSVHEYHYIFWYLYEFLYVWLTSALSNVESIQAEQEAASGGGGGGANNANSGGGGGGGRRGSRPPRHKKRTTPRPAQQEALMCRIMQNLCGGYYKALVAFQIQGKIPNPVSTFDNEAVRYKHRFAPLSVMTTPLVHYAEFKEFTNRLRQENPMILYLGGCKMFQQARTLMESIQNPDQEIIDLLKVAKTNFVVLKLLAGGHKSDSKTPPDFDFTTHRHFPIIKLV